MRSERIVWNGISVDLCDRFFDWETGSCDGSSSRYVLVRTSGPLRPRDRAAIQCEGFRILEAAPWDGYLGCLSDPAGLPKLREHPLVDSACRYPLELKITPGLRGDAQPGLATCSGDRASIRPSLSAASGLVDVVVHLDQDARALRDRVAVIAGTDPQHVHADVHKLRVHLAPDRYTEMAGLDPVRHLEPVRAPELANNLARGILGVEGDLGDCVPALEGADQIVTLCDTGLDTGSDPRLPCGPHPDFAGRVRRLYPLGRGATDDPHGHGTLVAGTIAGDGHSQVYGPLRGIAPAARLVVQATQSVGGPLDGLPADTRALLARPYESDGSRIRCDPWGEFAAGAYTTRSFELDAFIWEHRDLVACVAAGNGAQDDEGRGVVSAGSMCAPGTAKNALTIGASESKRPGIARSYGSSWPHAFPAAPLADALWANDPGEVAAFSGRGPTCDGRIKPDLVAPGTAILSTQSRRALARTTWGGSSDPRYAFFGGTSAATGLAAGSAALVREWLVRLGLPSPSAALVKALLINGARALPGECTPSLACGFGRIDVARTVGPFPDATQLRYWDESLPLETGDQQVFEVEGAPAVSSLKATLVWTDLPGDSLQNDLDLVVRSRDGTELHGNQEIGSGEHDRRNNVEQVGCDRLPGGHLTIFVRAHRCLAPQTFALVLRTR